MDFKCEIGEVKLLSNGDTVEILDFTSIPSNTVGKLSKTHFRMKMNLSGELFFLKMVNLPDGSFSSIQVMDVNENIMYKSTKYSILDSCKWIGAHVHYDDEIIKELTKLVTLIRTELKKQIKEGQYPMAVIGQDIQIWWVTQGMTIEAASKEGIIWAPQKNKRGSALYHWETLREVRPGDIILHYANKELRYVSQVLNSFEERPQPESFGDEWKDELGYLINTEYHPLSPGIPLHKFKTQVLELQPDQGPLDINAGAKQAYLLRLNIECLQAIQMSQPETIWPDFTKFDNVQTINIPQKRQV